MTKPNAKRPIDELDQLQDHASRNVREAFDAFVACVVKAALGHERDPAHERACMEKLGERLAISRAFADILGRLRLVRELKAQGQPTGFSGESDPLHFAPIEDETISPLIMPKIVGLGFDQAIESLIKRTPFGVRTQEDIKDAYRRSGFALIRSADAALTQQVQKLITKNLAAGEDLPTFQEAMGKLSESFTKPYINLVHRNAMNRSYSAGRQEQAKTLPGVVGFRYRAVGDADTRPNHEAADGVVAAQDDPIWDKLTPPLGHSCRCTLQLVTSFNAKRKGLLDKNGRLPRATIPAGAGPDPGGVWGRRADSVYHK